MLRPTVIANVTAALLLAVGAGVQAGASAGPARAAGRPGGAGTRGAADRGSAAGRTAGRSGAPGRTAGLAGAGPRGGTAGIAGAGARGALTGAAEPGRGLASGPRIRLSPRQLTAAAGRCAAWATQAGFPDNGYLSGSLTSAVAIALGESGCNPLGCWDNTRDTGCTPPGPAGDSVDRGAWQINSAAWPGIGNRCAFRGRCAARASYLQISQHGSSYSPWGVYIANIYARFLPAAQRAVSRLTRGTVTSGLIGSCLAFPRDRPGAAPRLAGCGSGAPDQQWRLRGPQLRTAAGLCLTAGPAAGPAALRRCSGSAAQQWRMRQNAALADAGTHQCLTDPGWSGARGTALAVMPCTSRRNQVWWRP